MIKFAVISFPGTNCEEETLRAFKRNGMEAEMVLWNDPGLLDGSKCDSFDGYCIAGGFSYEDRGRSGVVAAKDPITEVIKAEADRGKVVLGICNGAQILVETGLIPGFDNKALAVALAWNEMKIGDRLVDTGFYNDWAYLKNTAPKGRCAFNNFDELLHIPFAHGEGRFVMESSLLEILEARQQIPFKYADRFDQVSADYPITPNGAMASIAALCNPAGNVMAMMPHPERDPGGNGNAVFQSIKHYILSNQKIDYQPLGTYEVKEDVRGQDTCDLEIFLKLIITDNTERTIEEALVRNGFEVHLERFDYFGIKLASGQDPKVVAKTIFGTGELVNFNKQFATIKTAEGYFNYHPDFGFKKKAVDLAGSLIACDKKDFVGQSKMEAINLHAGGLIQSLRSGVLWRFSQESQVDVEGIITSKMLYNPHSMYLIQS